MSAKLNEDFLFQIFSIIEEIPVGKVATYGQIAKLSGYEKNARLVGKALGVSDYYGTYPCHRVLNGQGRLVPGWGEQAGLLIEEGVTFKQNGNVDLKLYQWDTFEEEKFEQREVSHVKIKVYHPSNF